MAYNKNIPLRTDLRSVSQEDMKANFEAIYNGFEVDHVELNDSNQGKHNQLTFRVQGDDPDTASDEVALFAKLDGSGIPDLFFRSESNGDVIELFSAQSDISQDSDEEVNSKLDKNNGFGYIPGGLLLKWGRITVTFPAGGFYTDKTYNLPTGADIPVFSKMLLISLQIQGSSTEVYEAMLKSTTPTSVTISSTRARTGGAVSTPVWFLALGVE